jgi:hypothetical protein
MGKVPPNSANTPLDFKLLEGFILSIADRLMTSFAYTCGSACDNTGLAREENRSVEPLGPLVKRTFGVTNRFNLSQICHESVCSIER